MRHTNATTLRRRRALGAVMSETVLVMPFIMIALMLIVYLGWNFRRLAQVTNMDRYDVWESVTPGSPGPDSTSQLNAAFYARNNDQAVDLDALTENVRYMPEGHQELLDQQADETYSYFNEFLEMNPAGLRQRFDSTHRQSVNTELLGLSELTRNGEGHSRMNGEWRYVNGVRYNSSKQKWEPGELRVSPGEAMRETFFVDLDEGLEPYENSGNTLAEVIRDFYLLYPAYRGPEVEDNFYYGYNFIW